MEDKYQYRLSKNQKEEIAQNLIDIVQKNTEITEQTRMFIGDWVVTDRKGKRKAHYDVWDIVLSNYMPKSKPILFRSCKRRSGDGKIESFTGRLECAKRFSKDDNGNSSGLLIVCDTKESLRVDELRLERGEHGQYKHTFYPLAEVLTKENQSGRRLCPNHIGEDEYIMRVDLVNMDIFRWRDR